MVSARTMIFLALIGVFYSPRGFSDLEAQRPPIRDIPVEVMEKLPLPHGYHEGLMIDGSYIWVNNGKNINTWVVDLSTGEVVSEIIPPGTFTEGITPSGDNRYWVTDWDHKKLYRVNIENGRMVPDHEVSLAPSFPAGVVWTGEFLYVITWTRGISTQYHILKMDDTGNILGRIRLRNIPEPSQLAWDGKHVWVTSWYNRRVYKLDMDSYEVLGTFRVPFEDATGIAWDGEHFWITGTYADLYKIRIIEG